MAQHLTPEQFVEVWQTSESPKDVVRIALDKYGVETTAARLKSKATYYRNKGVPLKSFRPEPADWDALRIMAQRLAT